jgi:acyl carrier protein
MEKTIQKLFSDLFRLPADRVIDTLSPQDVKGWDSMGHMSLIQGLEQEFGITFEDGDLTEMENVGKIKEVLARRGVGT